MKLAEFESKLETLYNKNGSEPRNEHYRLFKEIIVSKSGERIYIGTYTGRNRYAKAVGYNPEMYLDRMGIEYINGNDAPRGGVTGEYVMLSPKGIEQCREYREEVERITSINRETERKRIETAERQKQAEYDMYRAMIDEQFKRDYIQTLNLRGAEKLSSFHGAVGALLKRNGLDPKNDFERLEFFRIAEYFKNPN